MAIFTLILLGIKLDPEKKSGNINTKERIQGKEEAQWHTTNMPNHFPFRSRIYGVNNNK